VGRIVWACILIVGWLRSSIRVGEGSYEDVEVARFNKLRSAVFYFLAT